MAIPLLNEYRRKIETKFKAGNATEHTHRAALQALMESLEKGVSAVNEPKRIKCGAPDFIITREDIPLGYIEAKDIGKSLDEVERSEQMDRYLESLNNLILTDYLEFRWYVDGQYRMSARLAKPVIGGKLAKEKGGAECVLELLQAFMREEVKSVGSPRELADRMASLARLIHDIIRQALKDDDKGGSLRGQLESFRKVLLHDLTEDQFADMYAQTICYGLFTARCNFTGKKFTRDVAVRSLPKTNPFLRGLFNYIAGADLDDRIAWAVDNLAEFLHRAEIGEILRTFGKRSRREDPIVAYSNHNAKPATKRRAGGGFPGAGMPQVKQKRSQRQDHQRDVNHGIGDVKLLADEMKRHRVGNKSPPGCSGQCAAPSRSGLHRSPGCRQKDPEQDIHHQRRRQQYRPNRHVNEVEQVEQQKKERDQQTARPRSVQALDMLHGQEDCHDGESVPDGHVYLQTGVAHYFHRRARQSPRKNSRHALPGEQNYNRGKKQAMLQQRR